MALSREKFTAVSEKLFAKARAGNLDADCVFEKLGSYSPSTGQLPPATETVSCIREEYTAKQKDGTIIQRNDFMLMAQVADFSALTPRTDGVTVTVDGIECTIVDIDNTFDIVYIMQVRGN